MKSLFNNKLLSGIVFTTIVGVTLLPPQPAAADTVQDIAVGTAANVVTGAVIKNGETWKNAVGGAAAGAVVNATHNESSDTVPSLLQDAAVGAVTSVGVGEVTKNGSLGNNAITGAVTGVVVNVTK